jgi:GAF domain-containing protein/CheY-like chemotaxis protein/anti-sigma regulatory factor (Ser/Thr protein kinase)
MQVFLSHKTFFIKAAVFSLIIIVAAVILFKGYSNAILEGPDGYWNTESRVYLSRIDHAADHYMNHIAGVAAASFNEAFVKDMDIASALSDVEQIINQKSIGNHVIWLISGAGNQIHTSAGEDDLQIKQINHLLKIGDGNKAAIIYRGDYYYVASRTLDAPETSPRRDQVILTGIPAAQLYESLDWDDRIDEIRLYDSGYTEQDPISENVLSLPLYAEDDSEVGSIHVKTMLQPFADKYLWGWKLTLMGLLPVFAVLVFIYLIYRYFSSYSDHSRLLSRLLKTDKPGTEIFRRDQQVMERYLPELTELFNLAGESAAEKMSFKKSLEQIEMMLATIGGKGFENKTLNDILELILRGFPELSGIILASDRSSESTAVLGKYNMDDRMIRLLTDTPKGRNFIKIAGKQSGGKKLEDLHGLSPGSELAELFSNFGNVYVFPLKLKSRPLGILLLISGDSRPNEQFFSSLSGLLIELISVLAFGVLLERERHSRSEGTRILQETSSAISSTLDLSSVLRIVAHRLTDYAEAAYCIILLNQSAGDEVEVASFCARRREGIIPLEIDRINLAEFPVLAGAVKASRATILGKDDIADFSPEERRVFNADLIESLTILPIAHSAKFIGSIILGEEKTSAPGAVGEDKLTFVQAIASQAASAIENARLYGFIKRKVDQLTASYNVSAVINSEIVVSQMLARVLEATEEYLNFSYSAIYLVDEDLKHLKPAAYRGFKPPKSGEELRLRGTDSMASLVASTGESVIVDDTRLDANLKSSFPEALSELAVPVKITDKVVGVFCVGSEVKNAFTSMDEDLLQSLAAQIAVAMEKARLFEREKERGKRVKMIYEFSRKTSKSLYIDEVLELAVDSVREAFNCDLVAIILQDKETGQFYVARQVSGLAPDSPKIDWALEGDGLVGRALRTGKTLYYADSSSDPDSTATSVELKSEVCVPIIIADKVIGALELGSQYANKYSAEDLTTIEALGDILAVAIEKSFLFREIMEKAERLGLIDKINTAISTALDLDSFFKVVAKAVSDNAGYRWTLLVVPDSDTFSCKAAYSPESLGDIYPGPVLEILHERFQRVFATGIHEFISFSEMADLGKPEKLQPAVEAGIRHLAILPIKEGDKCEAVLTVGSSRTEGFSSQELYLLNDITVHMQIAWQNARLYEQLKTAYKQLQDAQDHVVQTEKLRALGEMSSGVVHDFNNIMAAILGRVQLMLKKIGDVTDRQWVRFFEKNLAIIETAVEDGSDILSRISEFTKRKPTEKFVPLKIDRIIADVIELTKPKWHRQTNVSGKKIEIEFEKSGDFRTRGNPAELREVFTNLINNAVDAISGEGKIAIKALAENKDRIKITIEDTGCGMSEQTRKKIFEPFFTTKGKHGTGLGLSVTYGIINRHGGNIDVQSEVNRGTTFTITLAKAVDMEDDSGPEINKISDGHPGRILVIDDEKNLRDILSEILGSVGYAVDTASGGKQALESMKRGRYDLIVTDLGMEGISGWDLADWIYANCPETKVVVTTGYGTQVGQDSLKHHHVNGVISKPFKISEITEIAGRVLSRSREEVLIGKV